MMRCARARRFRSACAVATPPTPPPRITIVLASATGDPPCLPPELLEHQRTVGPLDPVRELVTRTEVFGIRQLAVRNPSRIHAGRADTNLAAVAPHGPQHQLGVVIPL